MLRQIMGKDKDSEILATSTDISFASIVGLYAIGVPSHLPVHDVKEL